MNSLITSSFAKINLGLLVKDKRLDGFHNIETIFVPIKLSDEIKLKKINKNIIIRIPNQKIKIPKGKTNFAYKAAELFFRKARISTGVEITIKKNIPVELYDLCQVFFQVLYIALFHEKPLLFST